VLSQAGRQTQGRLLEILDDARLEAVLRPLSRVFARARAAGLALTGERFDIQLTTEGLGWTRPGEGAVIHVSPAVLFESDPDWPEILFGLCVHEIGHHVYHADKRSRAAWKQAATLGVRGALNLVADEQMERRLRALDPSLGTALQRLASWAFVRAWEEYSDTTFITEFAGGAGDRGLIRRVRAEPGRDGAVRVRHGQMLRAAGGEERALPRFFRALRGGMGNRTGDPLVAEALRCLGSDLKDQSLPKLVPVAQRLCELFPALKDDALGPLQAVFGTRDCDDLPDLSPDVRRRLGGALARSIEAAEREAAGEVSGADARAGGTRTGAPGARYLRTSPETWFAPLNEVVRLTPDRQRHAAVAKEVAGHSARLRRAISALLSHTRRRDWGIRGGSVGGAGLGTRVARRSIRLMRQPVQVVPQGRLFLGVLIDCSGSMVGEEHAQAVRFGVQVAEALRSLPRVASRFAGFTDSEYFDCGTAATVAVTSLQAGGGNNDAGALAHMANDAQRSGCTSRAILMISDGSPTECSVAALRALVKRLEREGTVCVQVALRRIPVHERCFTDYVEIIGKPPRQAALEFEQVVVQAARRGTTHGRTRR
jgi:hypothetical protein